jgi:molybdopterin-binding protein
MKMSARNHFIGTVVDVKKGQVMAQISVDIGGGNKIMSQFSAKAPTISH